MNPRNPVATHMSLLNGRRLKVGSIEKITPSEKYELDDSFKDLIIMPGLVEGHSHLFEGALWSKLYCGYFDRQKPDGSINLGIKNKLLLDLEYLTKVSVKKDIDKTSTILDKE